MRSVYVATFVPLVQSGPPLTLVSLPCQFSPAQSPCLLLHPPLLSCCACLVSSITPVSLLCSSLMSSHLTSSTRPSHYVKLFVQLRGSLLTCLASYTAPSCHDVHHPPLSHVQSPHTLIQLCPPLHSPSPSIAMLWWCTTEK